MTIQELRNMFNQINKDCERDGEDVVPLVDVDFYADQIEALFGNMDKTITYEEAYEMAEQLSL